MIRRYQPLAPLQRDIRKCLDLPFKNVLGQIWRQWRKTLSATYAIGPPLSYQEVPHEEEQGGGIHSPFCQCAWASLHSRRGQICMSPLSLTKLCALALICTIVKCGLIASRDFLFLIIFIESYRLFLMHILELWSHGSIVSSVCENAHV